MVSDVLAWTWSAWCVAVQSRLTAAAAPLLSVGGDAPPTRSAWPFHAGAAKFRLLRCAWGEGVTEWSRRNAAKPALAIRRS